MINFKAINLINGKIKIYEPPQILQRFVCFLSHFGEELLHQPSQIHTSNQTGLQLLK
jgi:hypothetical protein